MNNKLMKTDTFFSKIKNFFKKIFKNKQNCVSDNILEIVNEDNFNNSLKESVKKHNELQSLANQLLVGEISCSELNNIQTDEMIKYFTNDIKEMDEELLKIKKHIVRMRKQLKTD